jgi:putative heme transporter
MKPDTEKYRISPLLNYLAGLSWRALVIIGVLAVGIFLFIQLKTIAIPFLVAILVTALLFPAVQWLVRKGWKRGLAVAVSLTFLLLFIASVVFVFVKQVQSAYPELRVEFQSSLREIQSTLSALPLDIEGVNVEQFVGSIGTYVQENSGSLISGLTAAGSTAGHFGAGIFLAFFAVLFLLLDGRNIWKWAVGLLPKTSRKKFDEAGVKGWQTLTNFVKSQVAVAGVDAIGIGLGALILQVPLAIPIALLVFLGSFIPVVGAIVTGLIAVTFALIFNGWVVALLMLGVVLLVQLAEGHILQPFLIGKAVKIHPLAIVFAVAAGSIIAGIPGALFAVPTVALLNVMLTHLLSEDTVKAKAPTKLKASE